MTKRSRPRFGRQQRPSNGKSYGHNRHVLQQSFEKYLSLAREATTSGDKIMAESYYQHAEHYLRVLNEMKPLEVDEAHDDDIEENLNDSVTEEHFEETEVNLTVHTASTDVDASNLEVKAL